MRFSIRAAKLSAVAVGHAFEAHGERACRRRTRRHATSGERSTAIRSGERDALVDGHDLVLPSARTRTDHERQVDLGGRRRARHFNASASARNSLRARALRRERSALCRSARSPPRADCARGNSGELERVREPLAPMGERALDHSFDATEVGRQTGAAEGDERRVDVRPRPEHRPVTRDGSRVRSAAELDQHGDGAVAPWSRARRRSGRRPRAAPSRVQSSIPGRPVEALGDQAASRRCTGGSPRAWSRRRGCAADRAAGIAETQLDVRPACRTASAVSVRGTRRARPRRPGTRDPRDTRVRMPRPGPISSTTSSASSSASRPITPRMFSSTRKCWPSFFFGAHASRQSEGCASRSRRSAQRARRHPRREPRQARRACERRTQARSSCRAPAAARDTGQSVSARDQLRRDARAASRRSSAFA